jgi:glycosyltransferase involved in cell wall biosynthesis
MKIVHVIDYFQPQLGYQETFLAREQARQGHEVNVVTSDRYNPIVYTGNAAETILGKRIKGAGFFIEEGINVWRLKTALELPHAIWLIGLEQKIMELMPDVVHMHGIVSFNTIRVALRKQALGNIMLLCDDHMLFTASQSILRYLYPLFKLTFARLIYMKADSLVGVANQCKVFMSQVYGFPLESIQVIPLGADDILFHYDSKARQEIRNKLGIAETDLVFSYTGKLIPEKGPHIFVEAALVLMQQYNIKALIVGNGSRDYIEQMTDTIKKKGLEGNFFWHCAVPNKELPEYYSAADVAVWPREASLSMIEAMACSLPVIISEKSEVTERIKNGNGLTYKDENPSELAKEMEKMFDPVMREKVGHSARKFVEEELSWRVISRSFVSLYKNNIAELEN